jgi:hypothetical protein
MTITPAQLRQARALLKWPRIRLAARADVGVNCINKFENEDCALAAVSMSRIISVLESAGVEFTSTGSGARINAKPVRPTKLGSP